MKKIIGDSASYGLPKPNLTQTDPKKGDYVKNKEKFVEQFVNSGPGGALPAPATARVGQYLMVKAVDEDGKVTAVEAVHLEMTQVDAPRMYFYGDVKLPPLPDWNREAYPYAYIWVFGPFYENRLTAYLHISPSIEYFVPDSGRWCIKLQDSNYLEAKIISDLSGSFESAQWGAFEAGTGNARVISEIRWANFDVLNADGSVYLEASEPVWPDSAGDTAAGCGVSHIVLTSVLPFSTERVQLPADEVAKVADVYNRGDALVLSFQVTASDGELTVPCTVWMNCDDYFPAAGDELGVIYVSGVAFNQLYFMLKGSPLAFYMLEYKPGANTAVLRIDDAKAMINMGS